MVEIYTKGETQVNQLLLGLFFDASSTAVATGTSNRKRTTIGCMNKWLNQ
jgi:hypothetical protein